MARVKSGRDISLSAMIGDLLLQVRNLYAHCVQSEEGQYVGCIRERLTAKEYITLPK